MNEDGQQLVERIEKRMRPGSISRAGFLGKDERLADVLREDRETLARLGLNAREIADGLNSLLKPVVGAKLDSGVVGQFRVSIRRYRGRQLCPFLDDVESTRCEAGAGVRLASTDWRIRNLLTRDELAGPGLIVHLIAAHEFFEGHGSPYRVEPEKLARLLGLGPHAGNELSRDA
jgi:hypothetical protein